MQHQVSSSVKRKSHSHGSGRSYHSRRSSETSSSKYHGRRSSTNSSSPSRQSSRSPARSSHRRSSKTSSSGKATNKTPDTETKEGGRKSSPTTSRSPSRQSSRSPTQSSHRRTPTTSSSGKESKKTSDTKNKDKPKLRLAESYDSQIGSPQSFISSPGAIAVEESSSPRKHRSSKSPKRTKTHPESNETTDKLKHRFLLAAGDVGEMQPPPLLRVPEPEPEATTIEEVRAQEGTTGPGMDELVEAAHQTARQERREDRSMQGQIVVTENSGGRKKKYMYIAVLLTAIAVALGMTAWVILIHINSSNSDTSLGQNAASYPSEEDCLAVSKGIVPTGQKKANATAFGVEMEFVVPKSVNAGFLQTELGFKMQQEVLPALVGCDHDKPISKNTNIVAALLTSVLVSNPEPCSQDSEKVCSTVYFEMDVFASCRDESKEDLLKIIETLYQDGGGLLERLNLSTLVEDVYFNNAFEIVLPTSPSPGPTSTLSDNCVAIGNGEVVLDQHDTSVQEYTVLLDVMLDSEPTDLASVTMELEEKIQRFLIPSLAGCSYETVHLQSNTGVVGALVDAQHDVDGVCLHDSVSPCYRYAIQLYLFVSRLVRSADFSEEIMTKFEEAPLVETLELSNPFVRITVVKTVAQTPSASPSGTYSSIERYYHLFLIFRNPTCI